MADPFTEFINTELPRRPVTLTLALTGWDADPNDGGAPAVIANAPVGTWFREHTAEKWWRKSESVWEESGSGPGSVSAMEQTTSSITMTVDLAGTSPPAGTVVHNQAEYDALGYNLRYMEDGLQILPLGIRHMITLQLNDGVHLIKTGSSGVPTYNYFVIRPFVCAWREYYGGSAAVVNNLIKIVGVNKDIKDPAQSGTSTTSTITRDSGTWTVNEHRGRLVRIVSGSGAGQILPIVGNDATIVTTPPANYAPGACTFEIYEPKAVMLSSINGTTQANAGMSSFSGPNLIVRFDNIKFGNSTLAFGPISTQMACTTLGFLYCMLEFAANNYDLVTLSKESYIYGVYSAFKLQGGGGIFAKTPGGAVQTTYCSVFGHSSGAMVAAREQSFTRLIGTVITADASQAATVLNCQGSVMTTVNCTVDGGAAKTPAAGLSIQNVDSTLTFFAGNCVIKNCQSGVQVNGAVHADLRVASFAGSTGNVTGWKVENGAKICATSFDSIVATNEIEIDGEVVPYADLPNPGDAVVGRYGSKIQR